MTEAIHSSGTRTVPGAYAGRQSAKTGGASFAKQMDQALAAYERKFWSNLQTTHESLSPYVLMMEDYRKWAAQQPPRILPESRGETEENLAWLRERYSGELSLFQRIEALQTLRDMGIFSQEQYLDAMGLRAIDVQMVQIDPAQGSTAKVEPGPVDWRSLMVDQWLERFRDQQTLLAESRTLDDLFAFLDSYLDSVSPSVSSDSV